MSDQDEEIIVLSLSFLRVSCLFLLSGFSSLFGPLRPAHRGRD